MEKRNVNLDLARIMAAGMVMAVHIGLYLGLNQYTKVGAKGVQLFFILSGYLTMKSLEKTQTLLEYYKKRFKRIVPSYYFALLCVYVYDLIWGIAEQNCSLRDMVSWEGACGVKFLRYFTFFQCILPSNEWELWNNRNALWTMSSFAFFYLIAPLIKRIINNFRKAFVGLIFLIISRNYLINIIGGVLRTTYVYEGNIEYFASHNPLAKLYCFWFGVTIFFAIKEYKENLLSTFFIFIMVATQMEHMQYEFLFSIFIILLIKLPPMFKNDRVVYLTKECSKVTYSLYLFHPLILEIMNNGWITYGNKFIALTVQTTVILILSYIGYCFVEKLGVKFFKRKI